MLSLKASSCASNLLVFRFPKHQHGHIRATANMQDMQTNSFSIPELPNADLVGLRVDYPISATKGHVKKGRNSRVDAVCNPLLVAKLCAIMDAVADRVEMHRDIEEQRNSWNSLLLTSVNMIVLAAAAMTGLTAIGENEKAVLALKLSSIVLYLAAAGILVVMNKIQPSQLAEEQRNAARLFKQIQAQIEATLHFSTPTNEYVNETMEQVLALDQAYPLPLMGKMLDKFPKSVEPAVWWPQRKGRRIEEHGGRVVGNGWSRKLEDEMKAIASILKGKDYAEYLRLSKIVLKFNKILAVSGPVLTILAAFGSAFVGSARGSWAVILGVLGGVLACIVSTVEHGGQFGMVFEMYRSNAGFFKLMEETIETNLNERNVERRENGEIFRIKVALRLGRGTSELKHLAKVASHTTEIDQEFASKLF